MGRITEALISRAEDILDLISKGDLPDYPGVIRLQTGWFDLTVGICHNLQSRPPEGANVFSVIGAVTKLARDFEWHSGETSFPVEGEEEYIRSHNLYTGTNRLKRIELLGALIDYLKIQDL